MMRTLRLAVMVALLSGGVAARQQATPLTPAPAPDAQNPQPRFRGGANLVRIDAYVTADGTPVKDLAITDFEVLEDNVPQRLESFQLVVPRPPASAAVLREPNTVAESLAMARDPDARVFVLFMDIWHVQLEASFRAQQPLTRLLDHVIGEDDLVGVMHPAMAARNVAFARRMTTIAGMLKDHWYWGERGQILTSDPREQQIKDCYPDVKDMEGIADEMIRRRRESRTLRAIEDLIEHLENVRQERKFVFMLSEGWLVRSQDQTLARSLEKLDGSRTGPPSPPRVGTDPQGRMRMDPRDQQGDFGSCERERSLLAHTDHRTQFEQLVQRANRANVSFYPIDFRGLVSTDNPNAITESMEKHLKEPPFADRQRLQDRHDSLRVLAANTDGQAVIDTNAFGRDLERIVQDTGAYYLLGYYSTNTKLDGRYRRLAVRVKRPEMTVRARPGYLGPTEAELASNRVDALMNGAPPGHTTITPSIAKAFAGLTPGRGNLPLRVQAAAAATRIWITGELDPAVLKAREWQQGATIRALFEHEKGAAPRMQAEGKLAEGQRTFLVTAPPEVNLAPGRYVVRVELVTPGSTTPLQMTTDAYVPEPEWLVSTSGLSTRRGPSTGLQ